MSKVHNPNNYHIIIQNVIANVLMTLSNDTLP